MLLFLLCGFGRFRGVEGGAGAGVGEENNQCAIKATSCPALNANLPSVR